MSGQNGFDNIECEHLVDSNIKHGNLPVYPKSCTLASQIAGQHIPANPLSCDWCINKSGKPRSENEAVKGLIRLRTSEMAKYSKNKGGHRTKLTPEQRLGDGVGTELTKLIPKSLEHKGCGCKDYAKKMNRWGVEGCKQRFDQIVDRLVQKGKENPIMGWIPSAASRIAAKSLVSRAIRSAEKLPPTKFKWFTAVTTAPRQDCTLQRSIDSMIIAGFDPVIFAEPDSTKIKSCETIQNKKRMGVWYNWIQSCEYALKNTDANVIMTVQDDSLFHPDCKTFSEKILWPQEDAGFVSLYTPKHYSIVPKFKTRQRNTGVNRVYTRSLWGACALIWPREILQAVMENEITINWLGAPTRSRSKSVMDKRRADPTLVQNSDTAIGKIMNRMKRSMWFVDPSAVEHISQHSVVGHGGNRGRRNCMRCAKWAESLEDQVPINFDPVEIKYEQNEVDA